jgi:hypothetical protein
MKYVYRLVFNFRLSLPQDAYMISFDNGQSARVNEYPSCSIHGEICKNSLEIDSDIRCERRGSSQHVDRYEFEY